MYLITTSDVEVEIKEDNIKIINSYLVTNEKEIRKTLTEIFECDPFKAKRKRTYESAVLEWKSHNLLYKLHLFPKHTKNCDIAEKEKKHRMLAYFFLGRIN